MQMNEPAHCMQAIIRITVRKAKVTSSKCRKVKVMLHANSIAKANNDTKGLIDLRNSFVDSVKRFVQIPNKVI